MMQCMYCCAKINTKWKYAIDNNICPVCGKTIVDDNLKYLYSSLNSTTQMIAKIKESIRSYSKKDPVEYKQNMSVEDYKEYVKNRLKINLQQDVYQGLDDIEKRLDDLEKLKTNIECAIEEPEKSLNKDGPESFTIKDLLDLTGTDGLYILENLYKFGYTNLYMDDYINLNKSLGHGIVERIIDNDKKIINNDNNIFFQKTVELPKEINDKKDSYKFRIDDFEKLRRLEDNIKKSKEAFKDGVASFKRSKLSENDKASAINLIKKDKELEVKLLMDKILSAQSCEEDFCEKDFCEEDFLSERLIQG